MPCIAREDTQAVVTSVDASEEQLDSEHTGACGKVKLQHMDHIAEKRCVGSCHCGSVHEPVSIQEAMKVPDAKAAVDEKWNQLKAISVWDVKKVRPKSEVIRQAKKDGKTIQVANSMDL